MSDYTSLEKAYIKALFIIGGLILLCAAEGFAWTGTVYKFMDGDTIKVIHQGRVEKIRFYGIDTPEKSQKGGKNAAAFVRDLLHPGQKISIEPVDVGNYGRTIGIITIPATGLNLNQALVESGLAWVYTRYCKKDFCRTWATAQAAARNKKIGLWADPEPVPPWEYRRQKK